MKQNSVTGNNNTDHMFRNISDISEKIVERAHAIIPENYYPKLTSSADKNI